MRSHVRPWQCSFRAWRARSPCRPGRVPDPPWTIFTEARWAWINHGFLDWKGGFGGTLVVHGHTPPDKHRAISGMADPHLFEGDRLGLDGGSARTGIVTGAEIQNGRYRISRPAPGFGRRRCRRREIDADHLSVN